MAIKYLLGVVLALNVHMWCKSTAAAHGHSADTPKRWDTPEPHSLHKELDEEYHGDIFDYTEFEKENILDSVKADPEELKRQLMQLLPNMDLNGDQNIDRLELKKWMLKLFIKIVLYSHLPREEAEEAMQRADMNKDGLVTWKEYLQESVGDEISAGEAGEAGMEEKGTLDQAHANNDKLEDFETFRENIASLSTFKNFNELVRDKMSKDKSWLTRQMEHYDRDLDRNMDGVVDLHEMLKSVLPDDEGLAEMEVGRLFAADDNHDDVLSVEEMLRHGLFTGEPSDTGRDEL